MKNNKLTVEQVKDFKAKLGKAFAQLRKQGYIAKKNFLCCQSCAWSSITTESPNAEKVVFYHHQDNDDIPEGYVYLAWRGEYVDIVKELAKTGLAILSAGDPNKRILVEYVTA